MVRTSGDGIGDASGVPGRLLTTSVGRLIMSSRSFSFTATTSAVLVLIAVGLLGPGDRSAEAEGLTELSEVTKLVPSDAQAGPIGFSVAISGDTAVVGARSDSVGGATYLFQRDQGGAGNWGEVKKLVASDAETNDQFGYSVAVNGDTAVVGAWLEDGGGTSAGAAYVFQRDQGGPNNWGQVKKLTASDAQANDEFGFSVAVNGDTAVVGAPFEDAAGGCCDDFGAAYVFQRDQGSADNWGQVKKLTASGAQPGAEFGHSVAVSGDDAVVGAYLERVGLISDAGTAYVFGRDQGGADNWGEVKKLTASDVQAGDNFGYSVAVSGDTTVVGARHEDAGGNTAGAAYVFERDQGGADNWGEVEKLIASDAQTNDQFGWSAAISGDTAVVGARFEDAGGNNAGAAYVYDLLRPMPTKQPEPGDTDGDGCSDQQENGMDETLGGRRDYKNPWDFYDVAGLSEPTPDGVIDLLYDVLGVINHYSPTGAPPYDAHYDRGPSIGPNPWNMSAPDGAIDLLNDILGVIGQHSHDCR